MHRWTNTSIKPAGDTTIETTSLNSDAVVGVPPGAGADDPAVRPHRGPHPLPLLEDVGVCLLDQSADPAERLATPVAELGDSLADQLRRRLAFLPAPGAFHRRLVG